MIGGESRQLPLDLPHRPSLTRDDLVVSDANRMAVAAIDAWPDWTHPVLVIVGPEGSGKSHLAAAWRAVADASHFTGLVPDEYPFAVAVDAIDSGTYDENALFELVNAARLGNGFVLATSRAKPAAMRVCLPDLRSRLTAATLVEIGAPDDALLCGVLGKLFADRQLAVEPRLIDYLAARMERSLGFARRLVECIDREALASKERVGRALLQRVLERCNASDTKPS